MCDGLVVLLIQFLVRNRVRVWLTRWEQSEWVDFSMTTFWASFQYSRKMASEAARASSASTRLSRFQPLIVLDFCPSSKTPGLWQMKLAARELCQCSVQTKFLATNAYCIVAGQSPSENSVWWKHFKTGFVAMLHYDYRIFDRAKTTEVMSIRKWPWTQRWIQLDHANGY